MVADGDRLLALLGRVRRRLRAQTALQGAIAGALLGLSATNLTLLATAGRSLTAGWLAACAIAPLLGALAALWRRPTSLASAARRVDRAGGPEPSRGHGDRVFIGLCLRGQGRSAFAAAAIEDAVRRASATPLARVAPWRRPRGLGLLAAFATIAVGLGAWPWRSAAESRPGAVVLRRPLAAADDPARVEARAELDRLQRAAALAGDADLMALIAEAERLLAAGADRPESEIRERLAAVAAAARATARTGATLADALARVAEALAGEPQTRAWADAVSRLEARASERAAQAAAERLPEGSAAERAALAEALARAAAAVQSLSRAEEQKRQQAEAEEQRRRLAGLEEEKPAPAGEGQRPAQSPGPAPDRSLKRLERDLNESADLCRRDPAACPRAMSQAAESLGSEMSGARASGERDQLARTLEQELARQGQAPGRGEGRPGGERAAAQGSARAASGAEPKAGVQGEGAGEPARTAQATAAAAAGSGEGIGSGSAGESASGDPEPARAAASGEKHEVRVPAGPGPSRAQVIEGGARRGFAEPGYRRVYREYEAAVEEALDATAVPPGRRRLVRRYFELIHPR